VRAVMPDRIQYPDTYGSTATVGATVAWEMPPTASGARGEGIVIGVIDTGIHHGHAAFAATDADGYTHVNPRGRFYGVCAQPANAAYCNSKRIGVYDFSATPSFGADTDGHGTHTAGIALGNVRAYNLPAGASSIATRLAGVAPRANLIVYRAGAENFSESSLVMAVDQAIADGVHVLSWSIGGTKVDPWSALAGESESASARAVTNAVRAGIAFAASAGNNGPGYGFTAYAALPWVAAVGNTTADRRAGPAVGEFSGSLAPPAATLAGAGLGSPFGPASIVLGEQFGSPGCAQGSDPDNSATGVSNPWSSRVFNGEIVVCVRGFHSRAAKVANVQRAGGGGVILVNNAEFAERLVTDAYVLPAVNLGQTQGEQLIAWVRASQGSARGRLLAPELRQSSAYGPFLSDSSSTGPDLRRIGMLRPTLSAPGSSIYSAAISAANEAPLSGTSMAAPHVAGMFALLRQRYPGENPLVLMSALETTADPGVRANGGALAATPVEMGAGLARIDRALSAGLVLPLSMADYERENPRSGGDPARLNTAALYDESCLESCTFTRRVRAWRSGSWTATVDAPANATITVQPASFSLAAGAEQELTIQVDNRHASWGERFLYGGVTLTANDPTIPASRLTVAVRKPLMVYPAKQAASIDRERGSVDVPVTGASPNGDVIASVRGPVIATRQTPTLAPGASAVYRMQLAAGSELRAEISGSTATDWDLFVGIDRNGNQVPEDSEVLCRSVSAISVEECRLADLPAGNYYVQILSYASANPSDTGTVHYAGFAATEGVNRSGHATLPPRPGLDQAATVRVAYDLGGIQVGERGYASVILRRGSDGSSFGEIPLVLERTAVSQEPAEYLPVGETRKVLLPAGAARERIVVDVPAGATQLQLSMHGLEGNADLYLVRATDNGIGDSLPLAPPISSAAATAAGPTASETITLSAPQLTPGRWYVVPRNQSSVPIAVELRAEVVATAPAAFTYGVYYNGARDGHGVFFTRAGSAAQLVWYTYDEDGQPVWYLGFPDALAADQMVINTDLYRYTWVNGSAHGTRVGRATLTRQDGRLVYSWEVDGRSGSEPMTLLANSACVARSGAGPVDIGGLWYEPARSGYGANLLALPGVELAVFYLYAGDGRARWVLGQDSTFGAPMTMYQYRGFCPACGAVPTTRVAAGDYARTLDPAAPGGSGAASRWSLAVNLATPLAGSWTAADVPVQMLTTPRACTP
jgi:subtilisin family serine protease